jgi:hypothetical protein
MAFTLDEIRNGTGFESTDRFERIDARDEEKQAQLNETGRCAYAAITELVDALNCDYSRLEELREERDAAEEEGQHALLEWAKKNEEELKALESAAGACKDREEAEQRIQEDALSLEFRSAWCSSREELASSPEEFKLLLTTGGPAVRIIGTINNEEPESATLQVQDWFLPWTDYRDADENVLLEYCRCFYFGE